jgi:hypothetical protein
MSDEKPLEPTSADNLIKTKKQGDVQLSEEEMKQVAGGLKLDGIVGESQNVNHKGDIE